MSRCRARHGHSGSPTSLRLPREFLPKDWSFVPKFLSKGSEFELYNPRFQGPYYWVLKGSRPRVTL